MINIGRKRIVAVLSSALFVFPLSNYVSAETSQSSVLNFHPNDFRISLSSCSESSIRNLVLRALAFVGKWAYIWGGGRKVVNGKRVVDTIGVPLGWEKFCASLDYSKGYNWRDRLDRNAPYNVNEKDQLNGTDCSGFIAWLVKNTIKDSKGLTFLSKAMDIAKFYGYGKNNLGLGKCSSVKGTGKVYPGDIISMNQAWNDDGKLEGESHVYLSLGQFKDRSVLMLDMSGTASTVMIRGTRSRNALINGNIKDLNSEAIDAAHYCMKKYYPDTYKDWKLDKNRNYICAKDDYRLDSCMHWKTKGPNSIISDREGYQSKSPYEVLSDVFGEKINRDVIVKYLNQDSQSKGEQSNTVIQDERKQRSNLAQRKRKPHGKPRTL